MRVRALELTSSVRMPGKVLSRSCTSDTMAPHLASGGIAIRVDRIALALLLAIIPVASCYAEGIAVVADPSEAARALQDGQAVGRAFGCDLMTADSGKLLSVSTPRPVPPVSS